jgi:hypothetical protein
MRIRVLALGALLAAAAITTSSAADLGGLAGPPPCAEHCGPNGARRAPIASYADPSYVGSPYGLGRPSFYGFTPPRGTPAAYDHPAWSWR